MIAVDANLLLYAYNAAAREHRRAKSWLETTFASEPAIGLPLVSILAFVRVATDRRLPETPKSPAQAAEIVESWIRRQNVAVLEPGARHWELFFDALIDSNGGGPRTTDAHLAALAIEHGATLCTHDRDFLRFPKLSVSFPLQ
ncbi:MAG: PIN domain-containing protein [Candidatus Eremiobacteraeota bacterium]|nr:PIN domain-containing protein [Candidatus Eremiobacteraeota bacterium]MBV8498477.1 PIN domain-containing protein [Candidatus Eremiobacteraeota bacterium]